MSTRISSGKRVLLTGGAGFVGHHLALNILESTNWSIVFLDRLDCSGNLNRLAVIPEEIRKTRCRWVWHDLRAPISDQTASMIGKQDYILHLAALTHVDRSITDPLAAVYDNVLGTAHILEHARRGCERFLYFSTDEVFGPAPTSVSFKEWDRYNSTNPYSATKAGGEELTLAYANTYGLPAIITHTMNVFGERQHSEKFIPSTIKKVLNDEWVTVHCDKSLTKPGSRFYIHAKDVAEAVLFLLSEPLVAREKYNVIGASEVDNHQLVRWIGAIMGKKPKVKLVDYHSSRPGHDLRYALDGAKMRKLGWVPRIELRERLKETVGWTLANQQWL